MNFNNYYYLYKDALGYWNYAISPKFVAEYNCIALEKYKVSDIYKYLKKINDIGGFLKSDICGDVQFDYFEYEDGYFTNVKISEYDILPQMNFNTTEYKRIYADTEEEAYMKAHEMKYNKD